MGEIIKFTGKQVRRRANKKPSPIHAVVEDIASMSDKMDFFLGIGRKKRKGKYEYYIFGNEAFHRTRLDLAEMLMSLITESMLNDADRKD